MGRVTEPLSLYLPLKGSRQGYSDRTADPEKLTRAQRHALVDIRDNKGRELAATRRSGDAFRRMMRSLAFAGLIEPWDDPQWPGYRCVRLTDAGVAALERRKPPKPGTCRECGCTEFNACPGGCAWADGTMTICTQCAGVEP